MGSHLLTGIWCSGLQLIFVFPPTSLAALADRKEKNMSDSNQQQAKRVLGRAGARILTSEEIAHISGGTSQTFAFTHVISDDVTHD
jgi:hypothetical protein